MFKNFYLLSILLLLLFPTMLRAQETPAAPDAYSIHVLIIGQGDDLFARFGHAGIAVFNETNHKKYVYNYGTFSFDDPDLVFKYTKGYLRYWLGRDSYNLTARIYSQLDRDLTLYTLNLTPEEATEIAQKLQVNALPENRYFWYRHFVDNCSTRIRDILDTTLNGSLKTTTTQQPGRTYRLLINQSLKNRPIMGTLINYVLGREIDRPISRWDEYFLPRLLAEDMEKTTFADGRQLIKEKTVIHERRQEQPSAHWPLWEGAILFALLFLLAAGLIVPVIAGPKTWSKRLFSLGLTLWGLLPGLGGLILIAFLFTAHTDTHWNENIIITPATHLLLLWGAWGCLRQKKDLLRRFKIIRYYLFSASAILMLILLLKLGPLFQQNYGIIFTLLAGNLWIATIAIPRLQLTVRS